MGVIRVNYHDIEEIRYGVQIGYGKEGKVYFQEDDNGVVKIFHSFLKQKKLFFAGLTDNKIAFPKDILLYENTDLIIGYTMTFFQGRNLAEGFPSYLDIELLKKECLELEKLVIKYKDIFMDDICLDNIFYNNVKKYFSLIDTSRWYYENNGYIKSINELNWALISGLLLNLDIENSSIINDNFYKEMYNIYYQYCLERNKKFNGMNYTNININGLFLEFLNTIINKLSDIKGFKVKKISDLK